MNSLQDPAEILGHVRRCTRCGHRRKVNAVWQDSGTVLCTECSRTPGVAFDYSVRSVNGAVGSALGHQFKRALAALETGRD